MYMYARPTSRQLLEALGFCTYVVVLSLDNGITEHTYINAFRKKTAVDAGYFAINAIHVKHPSGTFLIYRAPVIHLLHTQPPNKLELVTDYKKKELFIVPWALHQRRIAPRWKQPSLL